MATKITKGRKTGVGRKATEPIQIQQASDGISGERRAALEAKAAMTPHLRHGLVARSLAGQTTGFLNLQWADVVTSYADECSGTRKGELGAASNLLTSQAMTLDTVFTEMLRRAIANCGDYPEAADRYMRMAMKAQAQSRATLEALAKLHQPREQTVRHVHVNEGGQAVIADHFHQHTEGQGDAKSAEQPYAQGSYRPALLGENASGGGVPIASSEGELALQDARRQRERRT